MTKELKSLFSNLRTPQTHPTVLFDFWFVSFCEILKPNQLNK